MDILVIQPSSLQGHFPVPPSKSHTLRALIFALFAQGQSEIAPFLPSPDTTAMIEAIRLFGARVEIVADSLFITGSHLCPAEDVIHCGNSGIALRFLGAIAALLPSYTILTGDTSIRHLRPVQPLLSALEQLGAFAASSRGDGHAPIIVRGPLKKKSAHLSGEDSQPVSGLLIAASFAPHPIELFVTHPGETPWIELTLSWLSRFAIPFENHSFCHYRLQGGASIRGFSYAVPGDFSSAAYPIVAALLTHSEITLSPLDMNDPQGDKALLPLLEEMGARFEIDAAAKTVTVKKSSPLRAKRIDVNRCIDALPLLAVLGCFAEGETELYNGAIARKKESDRIRAITQELSKMGASIEEKPDGLLIRPAKLRGAVLEAHGDHRIALSLAVAALAATGESTLFGAEVIAKSYPHFARTFQKRGAKIDDLETVA